MNAHQPLANDPGMQALVACYRLLLAKAREREQQKAAKEKTKDDTGDQAKDECACQPESQTCPSG